MTTVQKMKDAEKAALQNEFKYYSGLLAAHYSSGKFCTQNPNIQSSMVKNSTCNTLKTTANHGYHFKSSSFQHRTATRFSKQNSHVTPTVSHHQFPKTAQVSNPFSLRKHTYTSSVKVNPSALSYKSLNHIKKTSDHNNLLVKNLPDSNKQTNFGVVNKPPGSNSQSLMDELGVVINQLKQKSKDIDYNKLNHVTSKAKSINKCLLDKLEPNKMPTDSKRVCYSLNNISQNIDLANKNGKIFSSSDSCLLKGSNPCISKEKESTKRKLPDMNDSLVKPLCNSRNFLHESNHEIASKPCNKTSQTVCAKIKNQSALRVNTPVKNQSALRVNTPVKTPGKKKLINKCQSSVKKLGGTTLFSSKYKVVNRKVPCIAQGKKYTVVNPEVKATIKITPIKKHIYSAKKSKSGARLITTKYKIINKKLPCIQSNTESSFQKRSGDKIFNNKWSSLKTNGVQGKINKLNSKYKIVNSKEKSMTVPITIVGKKNINVKEANLNFVHERSKNFNKFRTSNASRKSIYISSKLHDGKILKNTSPLKQNHIQFLRRKKHSPSQNSFMSNSKYRTVNKQPSRNVKKISEKAKSITLSNNQNSNIDLDLLIELAAEKKECNDNPISNLLGKHILIKRVYKSKNAIVNKNVCSLQTKAAKMIKTKYSVLNKKHSWQNQNFTKRLISPKSFKDHKYQSRASFYNTLRNRRNNSRHHVSTYFAERSYSKHYFGAKTKNIPVGSFRSKRFVLNRKVYLKTQNSMKLNSPVSKTMASRVLNRSINRVLNASVKKISKVNIYCMFYNRFGRCNKGIKCPYVHDPSKIAVCTRFLRGTCKTKNCPFSHEICPGKMAICSFFLSGSCTKKDCPYRHETLSPDAKLCKAFVEGYCAGGKQCKHAHVLVCPQFVQGHCEKGSACPFPHPPPKGKKTIPNSSEKSEDLKETEEMILEKMSRYFECGYDPEHNDISGVNSIKVLRIRNLPEQPSFIAL